MPSRPKRSIKVDLPAPGGPVMPIPRGAAGRRQDRLDQPLGFRAVIGAGRFDERDGTRQGPPAAAAQRRGKIVSPSHRGGVSDIG
jgi:hypothetical protein